MRRAQLHLALRTGLALSEIERMSPEDIETVREYVDDENDAIKDARKG